MKDKKTKITENEGRLIAKARDKFLQNKANLLKGEAKGIYLKNRLIYAFFAGWNAARKTAVTENADFLKSIAE